MRVRLTVLFLNKLAKFCAPINPSWFSRIFSVVRVCMKNGTWLKERQGWILNLTLLFANAWARCCAPLGPIWLPIRFSVVSVCIKKWRRLKNKDEWWISESLYCFLMNQPDAVLLSRRFDCQWDSVWWVSNW